MTTPRFYTSSIEPSKTAAQIGEILRQHGATRFQIEWDAGGEASAIQFAMDVPTLSIEVPVRLTAQRDALAQRMCDEQILPKRCGWEDYRAQGRRTAWRQLKAWVEMCMEMVENGVKPFHEVFMADVLMEGGVRLVEQFEQHAGRLLPSPLEDRKVIELPAAQGD